MKDRTGEAAGQLEIWRTSNGSACHQTFALCPPGDWSDGSEYVKRCTLHHTPFWVYQAQHPTFYPLTCVHSVAVRAERGRIEITTYDARQRPWEKKSLVWWLGERENSLWKATSCCNRPRVFGPQGSLPLQRGLIFLCVIKLRCSDCTHNFITCRRGPAMFCLGWLSVAVL